MKDNRTSIEKWAEFVLEKWEDEYRRLNIGFSGDLFTSLAKQVISSADGDVQKILFFYNYYGAFVDMGVGKGVPIGYVKENTISRRLEGRRNGNRRRAKKWYNKIMYGQTMKLGDLMQETYGKKAIATVVENLPPIINLSI